VITIETTAWRPAERLTSKAAITAHLEAVFEEGDPVLIATALGDVARARGDCGDTLLNPSLC
jgi:probable addiction module antidote protein